MMSNMRPKNFFSLDYKAGRRNLCEINCALECAKQKPNLHVRLYAYLHVRLYFLLRVIALMRMSLRNSHVNFCSRWIYRYNKPSQRLPEVYVFLQAAKKCTIKMSNARAEALFFSNYNGKRNVIKKNSRSLKLLSNLLNLSKVTELFRSW